MEILIGIILLVIAVGAYLYYKNKLDTNKDGHVSKEEVAPVVEEVKKEVVETVKNVADVNKDGKVDLADLKEAGTKIKAVAKKAAPKTDKPAAKKPAAKKPAKPRKPKMAVAK